MQGKYSPTVALAYSQDQQWHEKARVNCPYDRWDYEGFDSYGYNKDGHDRAGYQEHDYYDDDLYIVLPIIPIVSATSYKTIPKYCN